MYDNDFVRRSLEIVCQLFSLKNFKSFQEEAIKILINRNDCFVCQPTGSGKSVIFQCLPYLKYILTLLQDGKSVEDLNLIKASCPFKVIVISPLNSLMDDQKNQLTSKGFKVCCLRRNDENEAEEDYQNSNVIFISPESILMYHRHIFREKMLNEKVVAFAVDESHCVKKWGSSSENAIAFRNYYSQLSELRSLVVGDVPMLALTATATKETKDYIIENLCMQNPEIISSTPERNNIKFQKVSLKTRDVGFFNPLVCRLNTLKYSMEKVLIFGRVMRDVRDIYGVFDRAFRDKYPNYKSKPYGMFHSRTDEELKKHILKEFSKADGYLRVLVATIAFGMGVNCKGLYNIIHFGPPATLEDYFQEAGRAGRDGLPSNAILVTYPRCLSSSSILNSVKIYSKNDDFCRRSIIFQEFGESFDLVSPLHLCCDLCETKCECGSCPRQQNQWWDYEENIDDNTNDITLKKSQIKYIKEGLHRIRKDIKSFHGHCGWNILSGFPVESIKEVLKIASPDISEHDFKTKTCIFNESLYDDIIFLIKESFRFADEYDILSGQSDITYISQCEAETDQEEFDSDNESDSSINFHVTLQSSTESL